jgi:hypothetical protein
VRAPLRPYPYRAAIPSGPDAATLAILDQVALMCIEPLVAVGVEENCGRCTNGRRKHRGCGVIPILPGCSVQRSRVPSGRGGTPLRVEPTDGMFRLP